MFLSVPIVHADPALLRLFSAVGFACGLTVSAFGFRRSRRLPEPAPASHEPVLSDSTSEHSALHASSEPQTFTPQIIRLSLPSVSALTTGMTQQEKVAAALLRAGIANAAAWADPSSGSQSDARSGSTSTAVAEPPPLPKPYVSPTPQPKKQTSLGWGRQLSRFGGLLLALISLYFFLRAL